jgi:hypothetical protein
VPACQSTTKMCLAVICLLICLVLVGWEETWLVLGWASWMDDRHAVGCHCDLCALCLSNPYPLSTTRSLLPGGLREDQGRETEGGGGGRRKKTKKKRKEKKKKFTRHGHWYPSFSKSLGPFHPSREEQVMSRPLPSPKPKP